MTSLLFYDLETTGLNKAFDQILQFAAIRTDLELNELARYELQVKLNPDLIPNPKACTTHLLSIRESLQGESEYTAVQKIHQWLNEPGTISLGYNTLGFDDEFLRFSFYRNLLPPYTHQYANQCSRMDLYPITIFFYLFKRESLNWPMIDNKLSLKLEELNKANQLAPGRAHNAMADAAATVELARRFYQDPKMWQYLAGFFNKVEDSKRTLPYVEQRALLIEGRLGPQHYFQCPVIGLGAHRHYKNQILFLRLDQPELSQTTLTTIAETYSYVFIKKLTEPGFILPWQPRFLTELSTERQQIAEFNLKWLEAHPEIWAALRTYHTERLYPPMPEADIEARLYLDGFWSRQEEQFCHAFHQASVTDKVNLTRQHAHLRVSQLALRILGRHYPEALTPDLAEQFATYQNRVNPAADTTPLIDYLGQPRLTAAAALRLISELRLKEQLNPEQQQVLTELAAYLTPLNTQSSSR